MAAGERETERLVENEKLGSQALTLVSKADINLDKSTDQELYVVRRTVDT